MLGSPAYTDLIARLKTDVRGVIGVDVSEAADLPGTEREAILQTGIDRFVGTIAQRVNQHRPFARDDKDLGSLCGSLARRVQRGVHEVHPNMTTEDEAGLETEESRLFGDLRNFVLLAQDELRDEIAATPASTAPARPSTRYRPPVQPLGR